MNWENELWPEWKVESEIGAGAFGKVYKIKRQDIGGTYYAALKVISVPRSYDEINVLRNANMDESQISAYYHRFANELSREFSVMEKLKGNSNIVSYEDHKIVPHPDGIGWDVLIRMELLTPLMQHLNQKGCDEEDVIQLGIDMCNALILCERENIIHRDIKPGNIFISNYGDYKLGDFSLALTASRAKMEYSARGTYLYMAPEVYLGRKYDRTIDIYSLGLILYRLLNYGRAPFLPLPPVPLNPEMIENANRRRLQGEAMTKPANASLAMANVILKACSFDPASRYPSAKDFQKALERCLTLQESLNITKQVANYVKKAVFSLQDLDSETPTWQPNPVEAVRRPDAPVAVGAADNRLPQERPCMDDFFKAAGDL